MFVQLIYIVFLQTVCTSSLSPCLNLRKRERKRIEMNILSKRKAWSGTIFSFPFPFSFRLIMDHISLYAQLASYSFPNLIMVTFQVRRGGRELTGSITHWIEGMNPPLLPTFSPLSISTPKSFPFLIPFPTFPFSIIAEYVSKFNHSCLSRPWMETLGN